jgi:hypothetical protein
MFKASAATLLLSAMSASAQPLAVTFVNTANLPSQAPNQLGQPVTIAGLSGIVYAGGTRWLAVMDNSNKVIELDVMLSASGTITGSSVTRVFDLAETRDFEDIALVEGASDEVWLCEEGTPAVRRYSLTTGALLETLPTPTPLGAVRPNFGFEALAAAAHPRAIWACNEEALTVDGPLSTTTTGTLVRLVKFERGPAGFAPTMQHAYRTNPIHAPVTSGSRSGVSALVLLPSGSLLALERSLGFSLTSPFQTRIFEVELAGAQDVSSNLSFGTAAPPVVGKRLLYSGSRTNVEGLALGPALTGGGYALLGIVDDGDPISINQLAAWRITGGVFPACRADWTLDGGVDGDDVIAFFADWDAGSADANGDWATDGDDVIVFFARWDAGC